jgi:hypothetical protein
MSNINGRQLWRVIAVALALAFLAMAGRPTQAQDAQWVGQFWNNRDLAGPVILTRFENTIDFNWFGGSPDPLINDDDFSARWTRTVNFPAGTYRFFATMDDGMRIWIDNQLVIDSWTASQEHTMTVDRFMNGNHLIRIDYFEAGNMAVARFSWQLLSSGGGGQFFPNWQAQYFNNTTLSGAPVLVRDEATISTDWGLGAPGPGVNADFWSARWTRQISALAGQYRIILTSDDGSRLFINNQLIIDNWRQQAPTAASADFFSPGGTVDVRIEFFEAAGGASIRVDLITISGGLITVLPGQPTPPPTGGGSCTTTPSGMQAQSIATSTLNVRGGPSTQFEPIGSLAPCQIVPLTGFRNADSTWVQIILPDGRTGWVSAQYLHLGVPIASLTVSS